MSYEYINRTYKTNFKAGMRILVAGKPGRILRARGNPSHLHVRFDHEKPTRYAHPTWEIQIVHPACLADSACKPRKGNTQEGVAPPCAHPNKNTSHMPAEESITEHK